jgi:hypothetical protein
MAHSKEVQQEAVRLHSQNWHVQDIAKKLDVPLRSVQRWISKSKNENDQQEEPIAINLQDTSNLQGENTLDSENPKNWEENAVEISTQQTNIFHNIINKSYEGFLDALADGDLRKVQILSNVIDKHSNNLYRYYSLEYLDINRAVDLVVKHKAELNL